MRPLNDESLSEVSGEGIGAALENLAIYSSDVNQSDAFKIRLTLDNKEDSGGIIGDITDDDYWVFSELRLHKSGEDPDSANAGGFFGSYQNPIFAGDLKLITESYASDHTHESYDIEYSGNESVYNGFHYRSFTANYTALPGSDVNQVNLSMGDRAKYVADYVPAGGRQYRHDNVYPDRFFDADLLEVEKMGNFYSTIAGGYFSDTASFDSRMNLVSDKFDMHMRIDTYEGDSTISLNDSFLASLDIEGFRLYGTELLTWVHDSKADVSGTPSRGLSFASTFGLKADSLVINADPPDLVNQRPSYKSSELRLSNVDIYLPMGTVDQPMTISTVNVQPFTRFGWSTNTRETDFSTQLRIDIAALPEAARQVSQKGSIFVGKMSFGEENSGSDSPLWTGKQDFALRDEFGVRRVDVRGVDMYAFKPRTYTYNEQISKYNADNPTTPLPYIPNENLIEIKGIEIQRLVITTQDL
jgi:hypothetical protein